MKKVVIAILVIGLIGAGGYGVYHHFFENGAASDGRVSSDSADAVYVDKVSDITGYGSGSGMIERYGGEIEPQSTLEVKLESDRTVKECFVKEGDHVEEGQRLFVYETREDEDKLAQAQIDIEKAEGEIEIQEKYIEQYEKQKAQASSDDQLEYATQILSAQNEIKQQEYAIETKKLEMTSLEESISNATVFAEMAGTVQQINDPNDSSGSSGYYGSDSSSAYITILSDGDFRVKGTLNEQNMGTIDIGERMIVYSRVDSSLTWTGEVSEIKSEPEEQNDNNYYYGSGSDSSNYPFYVELDSSEGLLLGQHVYMEKDSGQSEAKDGLWLEEYYITEEDGKAYVWYANASNVIEKHEVTLGDYDEETLEYEILEGLEAEDYIAIPQDSVFEGAPVIYNDYSGSIDMGGEEGAWDDSGWDDAGWDDSEGVDSAWDEADWNDGDVDMSGYDEDEGGFDEEWDGTYEDDEEYFDADAANED